jgi:hypothetical protein
MTMTLPGDLLRPPSPILARPISSRQAGLGGIITNLVIISAATSGHGNVFWDIALRDFGLLLAALALARLAAVYAPNPFRRGKAQSGAVPANVSSDRRSTPHAA